MRLFCWYCHKFVSSELPEDAIFRAIAVCPECLATSLEAENLHQKISENKTSSERIDNED